MEKFELVLKNEKIKSYRLLLFSFILLNLIVFLAQAILTDTKSVRATAVLCLLLSAGAFATEYFYKKRNKRYSGKAAAVVFIIIAYINLKFWWAAIAVLLIAVLYSVSVRQLVVYVNSGGIIYPSFPKKHLDWVNLNNIILKDGILTIDLKNNKLAQAEVINGENDYDLDEKEFNEFCHSQLQSAK